MKDGEDRSFKKDQWFMKFMTLPTLKRGLEPRVVNSMSWGTFSTIQLPEVAKLLSDHTRFYVAN